MVRPSFKPAAWILIALPLVLPAQPARMPRPWWDHQVSRALNLTDAQRTQIRQIQRDFRPRMMELRSAVNRADSDLKTAFNEDPVDQAKANDAINRLAAARADLTKSVSQMDLHLRMVLTQEQWQQLNSLQNQRGRGRGGRRRGPPPNGPSDNTNQQK